MNSFCQNLKSFVHENFVFKIDSNKNSPQLTLCISQNLQEQNNHIHQPNSEPVSPAKFSAGTCQDLSTYSTIRRSYRYDFNSEI